MKLVFCQESYSPHVVPLIEALQEIGSDVRLLVYKKSIAERVKQGWSFGEGQVDSMVLTKESARRIIAREIENDSLWILGGCSILGVSGFVLRQLFKANARILIWSEKPNVSGTLGLAKILYYRTLRFLIARKVVGFLAIGDIGVDFFVHDCGWPRIKVYEFGYFVERLASNKSTIASSESVNRPFLIGFAGQGIKRKNLEYLLDAIEGIGDREFWNGGKQCCGFKIVLIGGGHDKVISLYPRLGELILWVGSVKMKEARCWIGLCDLFVLPSRFDGWGVVANEALLAGVRTFISRECGASSIVRHSPGGEVFGLDNPIGLGEMIAKIVKSYRDDESLRDSSKCAVGNWADCITPQSAARYLLAIIEHALSEKSEFKPRAPWLPE